MPTNKKHVTIIEISEIENVCRDVGRYGIQVRGTLWLRGSGIPELSKEVGDCGGATGGSGNSVTVRE